MSVPPRADDAAAHTLALQHITYQAGERQILKDISLQVTSGELIAIVGRNGAGKTTLLHVFASLLPVSKGEVRLDGQLLSHMTRKAVARQMALLPQQVRIDFGFHVHDIVRMGRHAHRGRFRAASPHDEAMVHHAMAVTGTAFLAQRPITEVSGGERQLIFLAQALAQEPRFLLLDEPTANLDIAHQAHVMQLLQRIARDGMGVVAVIHDLSMAVRCFPRLILLDDGMVVGDGPSIEVLNVDTIKRVFQVQARFYQDQEGGAPLLWFPM
jgi:ABC-type cobalamin/Fe3+-siderophores transport system ATPase subunit